MKGEFYPVLHIHFIFLGEFSLVQHLHFIFLVPFFSSLNVSAREWLLGDANAIEPSGQQRNANAQVIKNGDKM